MILAAAIVLTVNTILNPAPPPPQPLTGVASWYTYYRGQAAAGPALRAWLGKDWRYQHIIVNGTLDVRLSDWCQCYEGTKNERIIDLDKRDFASLAPTSLGILNVEIKRP